MNIRIPPKPEDEYDYMFGNEHLLENISKIEHVGDNIYRVTNTDGVSTDIQLERFCEITIKANDNGSFAYNPEYGDDRICECGHSYYRHFDSYEDMSPVGCKYCQCYEFKEAKEKDDV